MIISLGAKPLAQGIAYRVFKKYAAIVDRCSFSVTARLLSHPLLLGRFERVEPMSTWDWLLSVTNGRRRRMLVKAWKAMIERGEFAPGFTQISPFLKTECLPWFGIKDGRPECEACQLVPRLIQAPDDETHIIAGPWLKPCTHALKEVWGPDNWIFYASAPPEKLDGWLRSISGCASFYWSDYSAYDLTWSDDAWDMVEGFYRKVMPHAPVDFWTVLGIWRRPQGKAKSRKEDIKVWYKAETMNASGRDDTALANALLNGLAISMSFAAALAGTTISQVTARDIMRASKLVRIAIVGDDSLVGCDFDVRPLAASIEAGLKTFGLVVKAECSTNLWDVTFLGGMPYPAGGNLYWGPTIGRRLYKAYWQAENVGHLPAWTKGVAQQMLLSEHVPILYDIAERVVSLLPGQALTTVKPDENKPYQCRTVRTARWDSSTVEWLCRRYSGMAPSFVYQDLLNIKAIGRLPAVLHSDVFLVCVAQDEL